MNRVIMVIILFLVLFFLITHYRKKTPKKEAPLPHKEDMVRCAHCGVHLPAGESITVDQQHFCSEAHRLAHLDKPE